MIHLQTRILVTHGIQWLPMVDEIIVIDDGHIVDIGTYDELISRDGAFAQFLKSYLEQDDESGNEDVDDEGTARGTDMMVSDHSNRLFVSVTLWKENTELSVIIIHTYL